MRSEADDDVLPLGYVNSLLSSRSRVESKSQVVSGEIAIRKSNGKLKYLITASRVDFLMHFQ